VKTTTNGKRETYSGLLASSSSSPPNIDITFRFRFAAVAAVGGGDVDLVPVGIAVISSLGPMIVLKV
jgi:hypothetical protein